MEVEEEEVNFDGVEVRGGLRERGKRAKDEARALTAARFFLSSLFLPNERSPIVFLLLFSFSLFPTHRPWQRQRRALSS